MYSLGKDIKAELSFVHAAAYTPVTAAGSGDATEIVGTSVDVTAYSNRFQSAVLAINYECVLTAAKTLTLVGEIETSADGSSWTDVVASSTLVTQAYVDGTEQGVVTMGVDLTKCSKYIRSKVTPDLSHTSTDTAKITQTWIFGGKAVA